MSDHLLSLDLAAQPLSPFSWLADALSSSPDDAVRAGIPWLRHCASRTAFATREPVLLVAVSRMAIDGAWSDLLLGACEDLEQLIGSRGLWQAPSGDQAAVWGADAAQLDLSPLPAPVNPWAYWHAQLQAQVEAGRAQLSALQAAGQLTAAQVAEADAVASRAVGLFAAAAQALDLEVDDPVLVAAIGRLTSDAGLRRAVATVGTTIGRLVDEARGHATAPPPP